MKAEPRGCTLPSSRRVEDVVEDMRPHMCGCAKHDYEAELFLPFLAAGTRVYDEERNRNILLR